MAKITAPWTPEQVENLNNWQNAPYVRQFACPNDHLCDNDILVATETGWVCPTKSCGFTDNWAYDYMADPQSLTKAFETFSNQNNAIRNH